LNHTRKI